MESPMKQRLIGAAVLVALAVIFLPMLVQGPAPDSGVSNVPLNMPDAPATEYEVRDLPLVAPATAPDGGAVGMDARPGTPSATIDDGQRASPMAAVADSTPSDSMPLPAANNPDAAELARPAAPVATQPEPEKPAPEPAQPRLPATTAGGDYVVSFGSFTTAGAADKVIASLRAAQLPGYRESATVDRKSVQRVRIGPYATRADAEITRQRALRVRDDVSARVVVVDADAAVTATRKPAAVAPQSAATAPAPKSSAAPAASDTGFAVQVGAFSKASDANVLRDTLRAAGFSAFTEVVQTDKGTLTRVRAGPVATRAEADQLKAQVRAKVGIDGIVRPHP